MGRHTFLYIDPRIMHGNYGVELVNIFNLYKNIHPSIKLIVSNDFNGLTKKFPMISDIMKDIDNENIKEWLSEMEGAYKSGNIHYEGSGDSGYLEEDIVYNDNTRSDYPNQLENWIYSELNQYGGWEINEGSQGDFHFNFDTKKIHLSHGENYEDEQNYEIPLKFKF